MAPKQKYDYDQIIERVTNLIEQGVKPEWGILARHLKMPSTSLQNSFRHRGIKHPQELAGKLTYKINGGKIKLLNSIEEGESLENTQDGPYEEYTSVSVKGQIKSVDDLVRACKIDLTRYIILDSENRKWDVSLKLKQKDGTDKLLVVPQYYVRVRLLPLHPKPISPVVSPIQITLGVGAGSSRLSEKTRSKIKRALIIPDIHIGFRRRIHTQDLHPFHDRRVLDLAAQIIQADWFDNLTFIGDCLDLSEFSDKFIPEPEFYFTTQPALIEWAWWLASFRALAPDSDMDQYEGNHDKRLEKMLIIHMHAAYGLRPVDELNMPPSLSIERLLALGELKVNYIKGFPDNVKWLNRNVLIRHGDVVRGGSGDSAKAIINRTTYTTIFGHIHRREYISRRIKSRDGDVIQHAICPGCACHIDGRVPGSSSDNQWQQGLAVVEYTDTIENIIPIAIDEGTAIYDGQVFKARDRDKEINKMILSKLEKIP
jgi:hypothetical protein